MVAVAPMPPEKCAYALARYSRSPDSIHESVEWVRTHDSQKFLESYYFQYGHASIADLGHVVLCFEGISELAATEVEDEQLWDGQAKSSRYQDFSQAGFVIPSDFDENAASLYARTGESLLARYTQIHRRMCEFLSDKLPRPAAMKEDAYRRNIAARAFDVARYVLFLGVPTNVGQVTSIRTLEKQIRRLKASCYSELREIAGEMAVACASAPACVWDRGAANEPVAPTLARHVNPDLHAAQSRANLRQWAQENLPAAAPGISKAVTLTRPLDALADIAATLLYPVSNWPYAELYELVNGWSVARRREVVEVALRSQSRKEELLRGFRSGPFVFDIAMDIGAYRDLHRHRRCQQFRQEYSPVLGYETPEAIVEAGLADTYEAAFEEAYNAFRLLPQTGREYLLPFGTVGRFLFKMDFAEAEYISRLRSGVKGHFSYRKIAWLMREAMAEVEPELATFMEATPPWIEDPLQR